MLSRWPVLLTIPIEAGDVDEDRTQLSEVGIERLLTVARAAFGEQCRTFDLSATELAETTVRRGRGPAEGITGAVTVSVNAVELYPESIVLATRIRPAESDEVLADARSTVLVGSGVTNEIRDELIALAQGARYMH